MSYKWLLLARDVGNPGAGEYWLVLSSTSLDMGLDYPEIRKKKERYLGRTCVNADMQLEIYWEPNNFLYGIKQYVRELERERRCETMLPLDVFITKTNTTIQQQLLNTFSQSRTDLITRTCSQFVMWIQQGHNWHLGIIEFSVVDHNT